MWIALVLILRRWVDDLRGVLQSAIYAHEVASSLGGGWHRCSADAHSSALTWTPFDIIVIATQRAPNFYTCSICPIKYSHLQTIYSHSTYEQLQPAEQVLFAKILAALGRSFKQLVLFLLPRDCTLSADAKGLFTFVPVWWVMWQPRK